jgi:hypothetical protein
MNELHGVDICDKNKGYWVDQLGTSSKDNLGTKIGQIIFLCPFLKMFS